MTATPTLDALHAQRKRLLAQIAALGDLRPGSLVSDILKSCVDPVTPLIPG